MQPSQGAPNGSSQQQQAVGISQPSGPSPLPQQVQQYSTSAPGLPSAESPPSPAVVQPQFPPGVKVAQADQQLPVPQQQSIGAQRSPSVNALQPLQPPVQQRSTMSSGFPGSLSDLVVSFESVKQKGLFYVNCLAYCLFSDSCRDHSYTSYDKPRPSAKTAGKWLLKCSAASGHREVSIAECDCSHLLTLLADLSTTYLAILSKHRNTTLKPQIRC